MLLLTGFLCPSGLRAARVKVIFTLPGRFSPIPTWLAYVDWYRPFRQVDPATGLHVIMPSRRSGQLNSEIIPLDDICQSIHLIPRFGTDMDESWTKWNVFDKCDKFLVNHWINIQTFFIFHANSR